MLKIAGIMVILDQIDGVGEAERDLCFEIVFGLIGSVSSACFRRAEDGWDERSVADGFFDMIANTVFTVILRFVKASVILFESEHEPKTRVDDGLPFQNGFIIFTRNIRRREYLDVGLPRDDGTRTL